MSWQQDYCDGPVNRRPPCGRKPRQVMEGPGWARVAARVSEDSEEKADAFPMRCDPTDLEYFAAERRTSKKRQGWTAV